MLGVRDSEFRISGAWPSALSSEFRTRNSDFGAQFRKGAESSAFRVQSSEFRVQSSQFGLRSSEFRVQSSGPKMRRPRVALTLKGGPNVVGAVLTPRCGAHTQRRPQQAATAAAFRSPKININSRSL